MSGNLDPSKPCLTRSYQLQSPVLPESAYSLTRHRRVRILFKSNPNAES